MTNSIEKSKKIKMAEGIIRGINGPVLTVITTHSSFHMSEMVTVGEQRLVGEIISLTSSVTNLSSEKENKFATVQVFEDTAGLRPGDMVNGTGSPMSVILGPGLLDNIFDGIQRPLKIDGTAIPRGMYTDTFLQDSQGWAVHMQVQVGDLVSSGSIIAEIPETAAITHKIMVPPGVSGTVTKVLEFTDLTDNSIPIAIIQSGQDEIPISLFQHWPIRTPRPVRKRQTALQPLITGQRVIDTFFPVAKGGASAIPGGFGTGKTITQHQLAKWADADIIVYIGCGERGNEMTEVLADFSKLTDPRTGKPLMARTVLIANTSNMPVAAREASIYTGITIAEYYRDMGYHVAIMADSTSRWAEALRELSGRLEEMPAEEGFPAYLASRLAGFYERAGYVETLNGREGSVTIIGAVSPQGADFSEPVTQHTKRFVRCFWALDRSLSYARHFPAIHWLNSYSGYAEELYDWYNRSVGKDFYQCRDAIYRILYEESQLLEIVKLVGADVLPNSQRLVLEIARVVRLGYLQQNAYHAFDAYVPLPKQLKMMRVILHLYKTCQKLIETGIPMSELAKSEIFEKIISIKYEVGSNEPEKLGIFFDGIIDEINAFYGIYE